MGKTVRFLLFCSGLALLAPPPARGQCQEPYQAAVRDMVPEFGNGFGCPTSGNFGSPPCGITYRFYTDDAQGNGAINPGLDGNPIYDGRGDGSYLSDAGNSAAFYGGAHPCGRNLFALWDVGRDLGTGDHRGYYGAQSQRIQFDETGNVFAGCAGTSTSISCFAALASGGASPVYGAPQGTLDPIGGLTPLPVPLVAERDCDSVTLDWVHAGNWSQTPARGGDPGDSDNPILGVDVYLYEAASLLDSRALTDVDLDAGARLLRFVPEAQTSTVVTVSTDIAPGTVSFIPVLRVVYRDNTGAVAPSMTSAHWSANGATVQVEDCDGDGVVNMVDNCVHDPNLDQVDGDLDGLGDACDNCVAVSNLGQGDLDGDDEGDSRDLDDGVILFASVEDPRVNWQSDPDFLFYNLYRGDIELMRSTLDFTQQPGTNPHAGRFCDLANTFLDDSLTPDGGEGLFWLVTGEGTGGESDLGAGAGVTRTNLRPCP